MSRVAVAIVALLVLSAWTHGDGYIPKAASSPPAITLGTPGGTYGGCGNAQFAEDTVCVVNSDARIKIFGGAYDTGSIITPLNVMTNLYTVTASFSAGSTTITVNDTSQLGAGNYVPFGVGIPTSAYHPPVIDTIVDATHFTIDQPTLSAQTNITLHVAAYSNLSLTYDFMIDLSKTTSGRFECLFNASSQGAVDVLVDDRYAAAAGTTLLPNSAGDPVSVGVNFGVASGSHRIRMVSHTNLIGCRVSSDLAISASPSINSPRVVVFSDSNTTCEGVASCLTTMGVLTCMRLGWVDCVRVGVNGIGFIRQINGLAAIDHIPYDIVNFLPDAVMIQMGGNDGSSTTSDLRAAVLLFYQTIRSAGLPSSVPVYILGAQQFGADACVPAATPWMDEAHVTAVLNGVQDAISGGDSNLFYCDNDLWIQGGGYSGHPTGCGNADWSIYSDHAHYVQGASDIYKVYGGYNLMAQKWAECIRPNVPASLHGATR